MERKDLNLTYIYLMSIFVIGITMGNIVSFFEGVGFAFVGAVVLLILAGLKILNSPNKKRFGDILALIIIEFLMFIILFFAYDFNINGITNSFPMVMRNICAIYSMLALGYVAFRYISEIKGKKYKFVEYILGNYTPVKKDKKEKPSKEMLKKNRELENGTLEPKPISMQNNMSQVRIQQSSTENTVKAQGNVSESGVQNAQSSQAELNSNRQGEQTSDAEQKPNVMDTIKNHPNYWN